MWEGEVEGTFLTLSNPHKLWLLSNKSTPCARLNYQEEHRDGEALCPTPIDRHFIISDRITKSAPREDRAGASLLVRSRVIRLYENMLWQWRALGIWIHRNAKTLDVRRWHTVMGEIGSIQKLVANSVLNTEWRIIKALTFSQSLIFTSRNVFVFVCISMMGNYPGFSTLWGQRNRRCF